MSNNLEVPKEQLKLSQLPKRLQQKFRNSIVFQNLYKGPVKKFQFDAEKIKKRKVEKQKTIEQKINEFQINRTQSKHLQKVFQQISQKQSYFSTCHIIEILKKMGMNMNRQQIDLMIWQFDEYMLKEISFKDFEKMYKKCIMDKSAAQPKRMFHLTQFLMYCKTDRFMITVQDTLELLYVRALEDATKNNGCVKDIFEDSIKIIFGDDYEGDTNGVEKEICFQEYLDKVNQKAIEKRKKEIEKIKSQLRYS